jgi:hypothetical protein
MTETMTGTGRKKKRERRRERVARRATLLVLRTVREYRGRTFSSLYSVARRCARGLIDARPRRLKDDDDDAMEGQET